MNDNITQLRHHLSQAKEKKEKRENKHHHFVRPMEFFSFFSASSYVKVSPSPSSSSSQAKPHTHGPGHLALPFPSFHSIFSSHLSHLPPPRSWSCVFFCYLVQYKNPLFLHTCKGERMTKDAADQPPNEKEKKRERKQGVTSDERGIMHSPSPFPTPPQPPQKNSTYAYISSFSLPVHQ